MRRLVVLVLTITLMMSQVDSLPLQHVDYVKIMFFDSNMDLIKVENRLISNTKSIRFFVPSETSFIFLYLEAATPLKPDALISPSGSNIIVSQMNMDPGDVAVGYRYVFFRVKEHGYYVLYLSKDETRSYITWLSFLPGVESNLRRVLGSGEKIPFTFNYSLPSPLKIYALEVNLTLVSYDSDVKFSIDTLYDVIKRNTIKASQSVYYVNYEIIIYGSSFTAINYGNLSLLVSATITPLFSTPINIENSLKMKDGVVRLYLPDHLDINSGFSVLDPVNGFKPPFKIYYLKPEDLGHLNIASKNINVSVPNYLSNKNLYLVFNFDYGKEVLNLPYKAGETLSLTGLPIFTKLLVDVYRKGIKVAEYLFSSTDSSGNIEIPFKTFTLLIEVMDARGAPLSDAELTLYSYTSSERIYSTILSAKEVKIEDLPPGVYLIILSYGEREIYRRLINVTEDLFLHIECNVTDLMIQVRGSLGIPLKNASIWLIGGDEEIVANVSGGNVLLKGIPLGDYQLKIFSQTAGVLLDARTIHVRAFVEKITVTVDATDLLIALKDAIGTPISNALVFLRGKSWETQLKTDDNGLVLFPSIPLEKLFVKVYKNGRTIFSGEVDPRESPIELRIPALLLLEEVYDLNLIAWLLVSFFGAVTAIYLLIRRRRRIVI
ncbi:MAG: hypothetical protein J7L38_00580 [Thermoproteales archaeon]|nr:hypothetical protein [Thermoproteales archaeon]